MIGEHPKLWEAQTFRHLVFQLCASNLGMRASGTMAPEAELFQEDVTTYGLILVRLDNRDGGGMLVNMLEASMLAGPPL